MILHIYIYKYTDILTYVLVNIYTLISVRFMTLHMSHGQHVLEVWAHTFMYIYIHRYIVSDIYKQKIIIHIYTHMDLHLMVLSISRGLRVLEYRTCIYSCEYIQ